PAPGMIRTKPPDEIHQVRRRNFRNAMPGECSEVEIFHALAIDVDVVVAREPRSPFRNTTFRTVALVNEWRDDCEDRFRRGHQMSARHFHRLTPPLENEKRPNSRPSDPSRMLEESLPHALHRRRI